MLFYDLLFPLAIVFGSAFQISTFKIFLIFKLLYNLD